VFEIPIFSNNTMVLKGGSSDFVSHQSADNRESSDFEKFYKISEKIENLSLEHQDVIGFRSLYAIKNIENLKNLKQLVMPYIFSPLSTDQDQAESIVNMVKQDQLQSMSFELKFENETLKEVFGMIKGLKNLEKL
jgi:hypothetical protein